MTAGSDAYLLATLNWCSKVGLTILSKMLFLFAANLTIQLIENVAFFFVTKIHFCWRLKIGIWEERTFWLHFFFTRAQTWLCGHHHCNPFLSAWPLGRHSTTLHKSVNNQTKQERNSQRNVPPSQGLHQSQISSELTLVWNQPTTNTCQCVIFCVKSSRCSHYTSQEWLSAVHSLHSLIVFLFFFQKKGKQSKKDDFTASQESVSSKQSRCESLHV